MIRHFSTFACLVSSLKCFSSHPQTPAQPNGVSDCLNQASLQFDESLACVPHLTSSLLSPFHPDRRMGSGVPDWRGREWGGPTSMGLPVRLQAPPPPTPTLSFLYILIMQPLDADISSHIWS